MMLQRSLFVFCIFIKFSCGIEENLMDVSCIRQEDCGLYATKEISGICIEKQCVCLNRTTSVKVPCTIPKTNVTVTNQIGGNCPCNIRNATCSPNIFCVCADGFVASADKLRCLQKIVPLGAVCENDSQCTRYSTFSKCVSDKCSCQPKFASYKDICQSLIGLDHKCINATGCNSEHSLCVREQCMCDTGYVASFDNTACLVNANYGNACNESNQCQSNLGPGAFCNNGICTCNDDFVIVSINTGNVTQHLCENRKAVGDTCTEETDCQQCYQNATEKFAMKCFLKECICNGEAGYEQADRYCVKKSNSVAVIFPSVVNVILVILALILQL